MTRSIRLLVALVVSVAFAAAASPPLAQKDAAARLVTEGQTLYRNGKLGEALLKFEEAIAKGATPDGEASYQIGFCYKSVREDAAKSREYMAAAVPLLEKDLAGAAKPSPYYYLSAIHMNELSQSDRGVETATEGIARVEAGAFSKATDGESLFQIGRLYSLAGRPDRAVDWYRKAAAALEGADAAHRQYQVYAVEQLANHYLGKEDHAQASPWFQKLLALGDRPPQERMSASLVMVRAGHLKEAIATMKEFGDDVYATEANYLRRVMERWMELGSPPLPEGSKDLDDAALQEKVREAAISLAQVRQKEEEAAQQKETETPQATPEHRTVTGPGGKTVKVPAGAAKRPPSDFQPKDPNKPTPDEHLKMLGIVPEPVVPPPPPSAERLAAEKRFYALLMEMVRRGRLLRDFSMAGGFSSLLFR